MNNSPVFTLLQVTKSIQKTLSERYQSAFWVRAEMNKLNYYSHSGHCYPDLVEKMDGKVIAQISATLWKADFDRINNQFLATLKEPLKDGIKILFLARITFDPAHGLSLRILEIDPSYTMGDLEKEKADTIARLRAEGVYNKNKLLQLPMLPQRIAIISVETSKGYADFLSVISNNQWHYKFYCHLFPSILQGERAIDSILAQLKRIRKVTGHFDVVAIIRGGGGDVGLSCYNNYLLASEIASFPIPVITGIGHATNETVVEMVSHQNAITPTKLADYLLQRLHNFAVPVERARQIVVEKARRLIAEKNIGFQSEVKLFRSVTQQILQKNKNDVGLLMTSAVRQSQFRFRNEKALLRQHQMLAGKLSSDKINRDKMLIGSLPDTIAKDARMLLLKQNLLLDNTDKNVQNMSPINVLKRGYSITLHDGKAIVDASKIKNGDTINTIVATGTISSRVFDTNNNPHE